MATGIKIMDAATSSPHPPRGIRKVGFSMWELYSPGNFKPEMDIVFFHGVQPGDYKNAFWKAWLARDSEEVVWPGEWLSKRFPTARILSVSYEDLKSLMGAFTQDTVLQFLDDISGTNVGQECPVFLVGHSLGGIIIKEFITVAFETPEYFNTLRRIMTMAKFLSNLKGVFYYSTPYVNCDLWNLLIQVQARRRSRSERFFWFILKELHRIEYTSRRCENGKVRFPTATLVEGLDTYCMGYGTRRVVSDASARYGMGTVYTIPGADHFTVCRAEDPDSPIITKLTEFIWKNLKTPESPPSLSKAEIPNRPLIPTPWYKSLRVNSLESETSILDGFLRRIEVGKDGYVDDGYFLSSKWVLSLPEYENDSLMTALGRAGYSEACQTTTTILFVRIGNRTSRKSTEDSTGITFIKGVGAPKVGDDLHGTGGEGLNTDKNMAIAHVGGSDNPVEACSSIDHGRNLVNTDPAEWQKTTLKSFEAAIWSRIHSSFCVSTIWLCSLMDQNREQLVTLLREAGYEKISETKTSTWYERIRGCTLNEAAGPSDRGSSSSSNTNNGASSQVKQSRISRLFGYLVLKQNLKAKDNTSDSSLVDNAKKQKNIEDDNFTCHPQILKAECSSSISRGKQSRQGDYYRQNFGSTVGKWPVSKSDNISTTVEKAFIILTPSIHINEQGREVTQLVHINLKAVATISLSCCIGNDNSSRKVRLKFSRISAEVKNIGEPEEESCNAMVLSYICTNVYGSDYGGKQIILDVEEEYKNFPGRRVLSNARDSWLILSAKTPDESEPGSTSLILQSDIEARRQSDSGRVQPLLFQDMIRPAILEGNYIKSCHELASFLKFHIRHKLEISYYRPSSAIPVFEGGLEEGLVWTGSLATKEIDFDCCLEVKTENVWMGLGPTIN